MQPVQSLIISTWIFFTSLRVTVSAIQCLGEIGFNDQQLTCSNAVGSGTVTLCNNLTPLSTTELTINKTNEGEYKCCCDNSCETNCASRVVYGEQTPDNDVSNILTFEWGSSFDIKCPYTPGKLIDSGDGYYEFDWEHAPIGKEGEIILFPLNAGVPNKFTLNTEKNSIRAQTFNPVLDSGNYTCQLRFLDSQSESSSPLPFDITVSTKTSSTITTASISSQPKSLISSIGDSAQFNCTASVPSFTRRSVGFNIMNLVDNTVKSIIADIDDVINCKTRESDGNVNCTGPNLTLECSYDVPYQVGCTLVMKNVMESSSSIISCFVDSTAVVLEPANLFVKPELNCSDEVFDQRTVQHTFKYPLTVPVYMSFLQDGMYRNFTGTLSGDKKTVSVTVPEGITTGEYRMFFDDTPSEISCPYNFKSDEPITSSVFPTPSSSFVSMPASSSFFTSITMTSMNISIPTPPTNSPTGVLLPIAIGASVSGVVVVLIIIIVLVCILAVVIHVSGRRKRDKYHLTTHDATDETIYIENGNHHLKPLDPHHLSPDQSSTQCDSYSHESTCTFLTDEPSPRHHPPSHSSRSSHSRSSNSCPSTSHLKNKPLPRYGIPDHYPQYQMHQALPHQSLQYPTSLPFGPNPPDITVITPTPTMENQPVLEPVTDLTDCMSPTGTEPFSSPNTPSDDLLDYFSNKKEQSSRPSDLPINPSAKTPDSSTSTPLSDQTMIGILLFLQHKDCDKKENCQTCKLIKRHFERIATKYGKNALSGMVKQLNTPGSEGTLKHLRKREKKLQRLRSPHRPQGQAPNLAVTATYQRQRSHSASHLDEEDSTFSSTETDEDSLKPNNKRIKPLRVRKAVTDDEKDDPYNHHRKLPLQRINEISMSNYDIPSTPHDGFFPGSTMATKGSSESDSTDGSTGSRIDFDSSKPNGLSMSYMKSPDASMPPFQADQKHFNTFTSNNSSSGYETDNVFDPSYKALTDDNRGDSPPQHVIPNKAHHVPTDSRRMEKHLRPLRYSEDHSIMSDDSASSYRYNPQHSLPVTMGSSPSQSTDYLKAASRRYEGHKPMFGSNLSPSGSAVLSMHSSPGGDNTYRTQGSSGGSNQSNHSIRSESALQHYPRTQKLMSSPPGQRKTRTPSPIQVVLPRVTSSATPI